MFESIYQSDSIQPGERFVRYKPKFYKPANTVVGAIHSHGAGNDALEPILAAGLSNVITGIAKERIVISADHGGTATWGNNTVVARISSAKTYMHGIGAKAGEIALTGLSMGGLSSLVWASRNQSLVSAIFLMIPVIDITDIHSNNRGGSAATINTAYSGGWSQATYGNLHNPITLAANGLLDDIPIMIAYGTSDTLCIPSKVVEFASLANNVTLAPFTGGHDFSLAGSTIYQDAIDFVNENSN